MNKKMRFGRLRSAIFLLTVFIFDTGDPATILKNLWTEPMIKAVTPKRNCADWHASGYLRDGVYPVQIDGQKFQVYCDMITDFGGWTVIQRRVDGSVSFDRTWVEYKAGFGNNMSSFEQNFWLGNDKIHWLTAGQDVTLLIEVSDCNGYKVHEYYTGFYVEDEIGEYKLHICGCAQGTAEDSLSYYHIDGKQDENHMKFSTKDRDNDGDPWGNCAIHKHSGWWFNACGFANLNGVYHADCCDAYPGCDDGLLWYTLRYYGYSVAKAEMKIRPQGYPSEVMKPCS